MNKPKDKHYFDVKVEVQLPAVLSYHILAETAEQAAEMAKTKQPNAVNYKLAGKRDIVVKVYKAGTLMMEYIKKYMI